MDYGRAPLADRLAAAHALGTLRGAARRRFDALLPAHPALQAALTRWHARLGPLSSSVAPVAPPERVWQAIQRRLFGDAAAPAPRWWQRAAPWRAFSAVASAAAAALFVVASQAPPPQAPIVVVLAANPEAAQALNASFVAGISADGRALVLRPIGAVDLAADRALELWALPSEGNPRSLGLVRPDTPTTVVRAQLLQGTAAFAVSVEPAGGSPTGAPTGPVVSVGKLQS